MQNFPSLEDLGERTSSNHLVSFYSSHLRISKWILWGKSGVFADPMDFRAYPCMLFIRLIQQLKSNQVHSSNQYFETTRLRTESTVSEQATLLFKHRFGHFTVYCFLIFYFISGASSPLPPYFNRYVSF